MNVPGLYRNFLSAVGPGSRFSSMCASSGNVSSTMVARSLVSRLDSDCSVSVGCGGSSSPFADSNRKNSSCSSVHRHLEFLAGLVGIPSDLEPPPRPLSPLADYSLATPARHYPPVCRSTLRSSTLNYQSSLSWLSLFSPDPDRCVCWLTSVSLFERSNEAGEAGGGTSRRRSSRGTAGGVPRSRNVEVGASRELS